MTDYPGSHSMDCDWFAVDQNGQVGVFSTGENGPLPEGAGAEQGGVTDILEQLRGKAVDLDDDDDDPDWEGFYREAAERGVFVYEYVEEDSTLVGPYTLSEKPRRPLHVDQLPPKLRKQFAAFRLAAVVFGQDKRVQPLEHGKCFLWSDEDVGYLASDNKTVRPIPGREKKFKAFCEQFRQWFPDQAKKLRFEEPAAEDKPRKKKK